MIKNKYLFVILLLSVVEIYCKWKIGTITNKTKNLKLEEVFYGKQTKVKIDHLSEIISKAIPVDDPLLAKPVVFNYLVSDRSNGFCLITAKQKPDDIKYQISFDGYSSIAIKQNRKKTQLKTEKKCVGISKCDYEKFDYCARAFIEVYSKDKKWESVACTSHGYNLKQDESSFVFDIILEFKNGLYSIQLIPSKSVKIS